MNSTIKEEGRAKKPGEEQSQEAERHLQGAEGEQTRTVFPGRERPWRGGGKGKIISRRDKRYERGKGRLGGSN